MHRLFRFSSRTVSAHLIVLLLLTLFATSACGSTEPEIIERTVVVEVIREVEVTREVEVKVQEIVEVVVTATPTPVPTATPLPVATATPEVNDYFVVLQTGATLNDDIGRVYFYASYPFAVNVSGGAYSFHNEAFYIEYLRKEGVITSRQKADYFDGEPIQKIPLVTISTATWKLFENDPYNANKLALLSPRYLLHYADTSYSGSGDGIVAGGEISLENGGGYVSIDDGKISVSAVDGNITTTVNF